MNFPFELKAVNLDNGDKYYLVYLDDHYMGHVEMVLGGWIFYDNNGVVKSTAANRKDAVLLGALLD
jgi:hypothetical protein